MLKVENIGLIFPAQKARSSAPPSQRDVGGQLIVRNGRTYVRALHDISFDLKPGEKLGLKGHNGAGKTSLLRILAGIIKPTSGNVQHVGRIGNMLNIKLGFRQEATGRRNIDLKCILGGVHPRDLSWYREKIIEVTELSAFIDQPIYTYSQGMLLRLAFGCATSIDYDILIFDEWLGAGDKEFASKAERIMQEFTQDKTVVIATHNQKLMSELCNRTVELKNGTIINDSSDFNHQKMSN